jgi:hypothetical protein
LEGERDLDIAPLPLPCVIEEVERGTLAVLLVEPWRATNYGFVSLQ